MDMIKKFILILLIGEDIKCFKKKKRKVMSYMKKRKRKIEYEYTLTIYTQCIIYT